MNKIYRVVWNNSLNIWQCVSELAKGRGKSKSQRSGEITTPAGIKFALSALVLAMGTISYQAVAEEVTVEGAPGVSGTVAQRKTSTDPVGSISTAGKVMNDTLASRQSATIKGDTITIDGNQGATNRGIVKFIYEMGWGTDNNKPPQALHHNINPDATYFRYLKLDSSRLLISNPTNSPEGKFRFDGLWAGAEAGKHASKSTITLDNAEVLLNNSSSSGGLAVGPNSSVDITNNSTFTSIFARNIGTVNVTNSTLAVTQDVTTFEGFSREGELKGENVNTAQLGTFNFDNGVLESLYRAARPNDPGMFKGNLVLKNDTEIKVDSRKTFIQGGGVVRDDNGAKSAVNVTGGGTLVYTSANTYTGNTNVKAGTLQLGNEGGAVAGTDGTTGDIARGTEIVLGSGTTLRVQRSNEYTLDNKIVAENGEAGQGNLVQAGSGTTIISNAENTFSGDTAIRGGVLQFESIGSMGQGTTAVSTGITETVTTPATEEGAEPTVSTVDKKGWLRINFTEDATISRDIDGIGSVEKTNTATVKYSGEGTYTGKTVVSGGVLDITSDGKINGTSDVLIDNKDKYADNANVATLIVNGLLQTAAPESNYGDVVIDNGTLIVKNGGTANVGNIKSTDVKGTDEDKSTVTIEEGGSLTTNLVNGDTLFENFKTDPGHEGILISGTLTANVADGATVLQEESAALKGNGTFAKDGNGTFKLTRDNQIGATWVKDGTLDLNPDKTLTTTTVKVGDNKAEGATVEAEKTAKFNVLGSVTGATDVIVDSDGYLKIGDDANTGSISTTNLTVDGGTVDIVKGSATVTTTDVKDGTLNVGKDTTLITNDLKAGDVEGSHNPASAKVNIDGTATVNGTMTIKPDAAVNVGTNDADGVTGETGTLTANNLTMDGGTFDVNKGTARVKNETTVNNGTITIDENTSFSAGPENGTPKDIVLNGGTLNAAGDVNAKNITSNDAGTDDVNAVIDVKSSGKLNLTPANGDTLFDGFNHAEGDTIGIGGELNVKVADGTEISQEKTAEIGAAADGTKGTLNKTGEGDLELTSASNVLGTTNIKDGLLKVKEGAGLNSDAINVGFSTPDDNNDDSTVGTRDGLVADGTVQAKTLQVTNGSVDVGKTGTLTATESAQLDKGEITVAGDADNKGTFNVGTVDDEGNLVTPKDFKLNSGTVTVDGNLNAKNITSDTADSARDTGEDAILKVGSTGVVSLKPAAGETLFDGFDNTKGDGIKVGGELAVEVADGKVTQNANAPIEPLGSAEDGGESIKGKLTKAGNGELSLTATTNTVGETLVKDGTLSVAEGSTLDSTTVNIGDSDEGKDTAKLNVDGGSLTATNVNVKPDGHLNVGSNDPDGKTGTVNTANLTVDGGLVDVNKGKLTATGDTTVNDGTLTVDEGTTLTTANLKAGDNKDEQGTNNKTNAFVNVNGTLEATGDITVNPDAKVTVGTDAEGDNPAVKGTLKGNNLVLEGGEVDVVEGKAEITTDTNVKDGTLNVDEGATLKTANLKAGDNKDEQGTNEATNAFVNVNGTVEASGDITVNPDAKVTVGTDAEGDNPAVEGTLKGNNLVLEGGEVDVVEGKAEITTDTNVKDGTLNVDKGATLTTTNLKAGDDQDGQNSGEPINAHVNIDGAATVNGKMTVKPDAAVNVGTNDTPASEDGSTPATVGDTGSLTAKTFTMDGGTLDVNKGTMTTENATVNDGVLTVDKDGTVNVAEIPAEDADPAATPTPKALTLNGGTLDVAGTVNAENVVSNEPSDNDVNAVIKVREDGSLALKPTGDKPLFDGFKQGDSDTIEVGGKLIVDTADNVNVAQNPDAPINPLTVATPEGEEPVAPIKGTLEKVGNGSLLLTAPKNTLGTTFVKDGTLGIKPDTVLNSDTVNIGDRDEGPDTAKLNIEGTLKAADVNVRPDGHLNIGTNADPDAGTSDVKGKLETTNLTIDSGSVDLNVGEADIDTTNINDGTFTTDKGTTLDSDNINIGNNPDGNNTDGSPNTAKLQANGDVTAENVAVKSDGALDIGSNDNPDDKGKLTATNVTLDGGRVDLNNGEADIDTTQINKGKVTIDADTTFDSDNINVGNNTDNNGDPASEAGIQIDGTVTAKTVTVNPDGTLDVGTNDGTQKGALKTDNLVLEGGPANINNGTVDTPNDIVVNGTTLTIDEGAEVTAPNVITTDPIGDDTKASSVEIAGTLNVAPKDGAKLFDGFQTNPTRTPAAQDGINVANTGTLNITTPEDGVVTQDVDTPITGSGTINKKGPGELNVLADNPFEGTVNTKEGTLRLTDNGKLGDATVNVENGATLAVDAPTTEVGNLNLSPDSTFAIKATPDGVSELVVNGEMNLNGKFFTDVKEFKDSPDLDKIDLSRAIVSSKGARNGTFSSYDDNSNLFNFIPDYSNPNEVKFIVRPAKDDLRTIANRLGYDQAKSIASALDSIFAKDPTGPLARLFYSIQDDKGSMEALEQTLPALAGATTKVIGDESRRLARATPRYICHPDYELNEKRAWGRASGHWDHLRADSGASGYSGDYYQLAMGTDKCFWDNTLRLGIMAGYTKGHIRASGNSSYTLMQNELIQLGIYGNRLSKNRKYNVDFRLGYGFASAHHTRNIYFANREARGSYDSNLWYAGLGLNYHRGNYTPYIRADFQQVRNNAYREKGAGALNLHVDKQIANSLLLTAGVEYDRKINDKWEIGGQLAASYEALGHNNVAKAQLEGAQGVTFKSPAARYSRLSGLAEIKMVYHIKPHTSLKVNYYIQGNSRYHSSNVDLTLRIRY